MTWTTVFDSAVSGEYVETLAGKTHTFTQRSVRYVRDYLNGSTANSGNHWTEIEVWGTATTAYVGDYFEWNGSVETMTRYYAAGGTRVAVRNSNGSGTDGLVYLLGDHLGSASLTADPLDGDKLSEVRYKAWGETRHTLTNAPTDRRYTGQTSEEAGIGLYYYGARFYDSALGRFVSPDSIIPGTENPLAWDRYAYTFNNPVRYNDPSGHCPWCLVGALVGAAIGYGAQVYNNYQNGVTGSAAWTQNISAEPIVGGALIGAGAVIFAPAAVAAAGDVLVGAGVATGSTALFGVGMSAYGASSTLTNTILGTTAVQDIMDDGLSVAEGEFSVWDWSAYPQGSAPKPAGPFRLLDGDEYATARTAADRANTALHQRNPAFDGLQIHEIHPVKFGGNPTDLSNKIPLTRLEHAQYTTWWNMLQRSIEQ